jgi:hypothetical protein
MKQEYLTFAKDYLLLHEILATLRGIGLTITASGSEVKGHVPIYEFQIPTARLHFGTLVGLLNNPENFKPEPGQILYLMNLKTTKEQVTGTKYNWYEVATAVSTLEANGDVTMELEGAGLELEGKIVQMTKAGFISLNTKKYLKQYQQERNEEIAQKSIISTNYWMKAFTGVIAISAAITLIFQIITYKAEDTKPQKVVITQPPCIPNTKDSISNAAPKGENNKAPSIKK